MRQRVMIALAFSCEPELIIADEPTTALDVTVQLQVLRLLKHKARPAASVLFISHDMAVVSQLCDRLYVMYAGSVIESGTTQTLIHHPVHPYSIGLLQCAPENGEPRDMLPAIPGTVPNLTRLPRAVLSANAVLPGRNAPKRRANAQWRAGPAGGLLVSATEKRHV
jgi:peptide/nickel transport system ATP-binding protein